MTARLKITCMADKIVIKNNPRSPVPKIRLEKRAGKSVTTISGLHTYGAKRLDAIAGELKSMFGTGGTIKNGTIEIQGDKAEDVKKWFIMKKIIILLLCLLPAAYYRVALLLAAGLRIRKRNLPTR